MRRTALPHTSHYVKFTSELDNVLRVLLAALRENIIHGFRSMLSISLERAIQLLRCQQTMKIF
jgi:hypothetical protein